MSSAVTVFAANQAIAGKKGDQGNPGAQGPPGAGLPWPVINPVDAPYLADPTGATDSTTAIQDAWNDACSGGYGDIFLEGIFKISAPLVAPLSNCTRVWGDGKLNVASGGGAFDFSAGQANEVYIDGLTVNSGSEGQTGILSGAAFMYISNCGFFNFNVAIDGNGGGYAADVAGCTFGVGAGGTTGTGITGVQPLNVRQCSFASFQSNAIYQNAQNAHIETSTFHACGVADSTAAILFDAGATGCRVTGCGFTSNTIDVQFASGAYGNDWGASGATKVTDGDGGNTPPLVNPAGVITAAATIAPKGRIVHVSGTTTINTITSPTNSTNTSAPIVLYLIFDTSGGNLGTSGNVLVGFTASAAGQMLVLVYDHSTSKWYHQ